MSERLFYIQYIGDYAYDYMLWWAPNKSGYTYDIDKAGVYTEEEAKSICAMRGKEQAWAVDEIGPGIERAVNISQLRRAAVEPHFLTKRGETARDRIPRTPKLSEMRDPYTEGEDDG